MLVALFPKILPILFLVKLLSLALISGGRLRAGRGAFQACQVVPAIIL